MKIADTSRNRIINFTYYVNEFWNDNARPKKYDVSDADLTDYKYNFDDYIDKATEIIGNTPFGIRNFRTIMFTPLDNEYFDWLQANNLPHSGLNAATYAKNMGDEKAKQLWDKYDLGHVYHCGVLYIAAFVTPDFSGTAHMHINSSRCKKLEKIVENLYDDVEVWFPGDVFTADKMETIGEEYFKKHTGLNFRNCKSNYKSRQHVGDDLYSLTLVCAPYIIHERLDCEVNVNDVIFGEYQSSKDYPYSSISAEEMEEIIDLNGKILDEAQDSIVCALTGQREFKDTEEDICNEINNMLAIRNKEKENKDKPDVEDLYNNIEDV